MREYQRDTGPDPKDLPMAKAGIFFICYSDEYNNVVIDYKIKYKICMGPHWYKYMIE